MKQRTIKFRAWDKKRQVMIGTDYPNNWGNNKEEWYCDVDMMDLIGIENINSNDKFELMQSTNILDVDGNLIYEGDIVERFNHISTRTIVEWKQDKSTGIGFNISANQRNGDKTCWKVIGNLYQNPELLNI